MIYLTGDTHGEMSMGKLGGSEWPEGKLLSKSDYLIILGDFGLIWDLEPSKTEDWWLKWLDDKPWTTLFLDGNHENFERLGRLEKVPMFNGIVGKVTASVFHLMRGGIYTIDNRTFFTFGGGTSVDKEMRREKVSWWKEELPSRVEMDLGIERLEKAGWKVDYILAHTVPVTIANMILNQVVLPGYSRPENDPLEKYLEHICRITSFSEFYAGHWHLDKDFGKFRLLYNKIVKI